MQRFAKRLRKLRKELGLNQKELASELGYARTTIANYEQATRFPPLDTLFEIANYFHVSLDYLLGRTKIRNIFKDILLENLKTPVFLIDPQTGKIIDFNQTALDYYGYSKKQFQQKNIFDINCLEADQVAAKMKLTLQRGRRTHRFIHRLANNEKREVIVFSSPLNINDHTVLYSVIFDLSKSNSNLNNAHIFAEILQNIFNKKLPILKDHHSRVNQVTNILAEELNLSAKSKLLLDLSSNLHDIGFLLLPTQILTKASLSSTEFALVKEHAYFGFEILRKLNFELAEIILQHHERIDGSGYPDQLKNNEIRIEAKVIAVADVLAAMNSERPYREKPGFKKSIDELNKYRDSKYDNQVVSKCLKLAAAGKFDFLK
jgi:PAS domain S-box-containing protein